MRALALLAMLVVFSLPVPLTAQGAHAAAVAGPPALALVGSNGQRTTVNEALLHTLPRTTVRVHNAHANTDESYEGVELAAVLGRVDAPLGPKLHGQALTLLVVATGADGYRAVYSLAEIDPGFHAGEVIVADRLNGQPIGEKEGPFKLVSTEDKRPARWVRNLASLQLETAP